MMKQGEKHYFFQIKWAYELGLTNAQYEAVYEINLDYLLNMQGENTLLVIIGTS